MISFDEADPVDRMLTALVTSDLESASEILEILEKDPDDFLLDQFGTLRTIPKSEIVKKLRSLITEQRMKLEAQAATPNSETEPHGGSGPPNNS